MGSTAHLVLLGPRTLLDSARTRLFDLDARWSRFLPDSEISRLNAAAGGPPVRVSADTVAVLQVAVDAWTLTGGRYDPTVLPALTASGYDRTFEEVARDGEPTVELALPTPGCTGIEIDPDRLTVRLPTGSAVDLGGIGKGFAADLLTAELLEQGAAGACVNLGGDVRCAGDVPEAGGWVVAIADELDPSRSIATVALHTGAVATSTSLRRRWRRGGTEMHHLIDPRTGQPCRGDLAAVSVIAAEAHWAEVFAKAAFIAGGSSGQRLLADHGLAGLLRDTAGGVHPCGNWKDYTLWTASSGGTWPAPAG